MHNPNYNGKKTLKEMKKLWVQLYWPGCLPPPIHRREPTTAQHGDFCLLRFRPGPIRPSLDNLDTPSSLEVTILMPSLVRTPDRHRATTDSNPDLKPSTTTGLQVTGLQEYATTPSRKQPPRLGFISLTCFISY